MCTSKHQKHEPNCRLTNQSGEHRVASVCVFSVYLHVEDSQLLSRELSHLHRQHLRFLQDRKVAAFGAAQQSSSAQQPQQADEPAAQSLLQLVPGKPSTTSPGRGGNRGRGNHSSEERASRHDGRDSLQLNSRSRKSSLQETTRNFTRYLLTLSPTLGKVPLFQLRDPEHKAVRHSGVFCWEGK